MNVNNDNNEIEQLLASMPDIEDRRSKLEILNRLKQDNRLQSPQRKKNRTWVPASVAVAAMLVLGLLIPSMLKGNEGAMEDKSSESMTTMNAITEKAAPDAAEVQESADIFTARATMESHVVLPTGLHGVKTVRIGMAHAATVVPITFLIPDERLLADFPEGGSGGVALYNQYATQLPETDLGFDDYHPYPGELTEEKQVVVHKVPDDHSFDLASATYSFYMNSMQETFLDYEKFITVDVNGNPAVFDQVGTMQPVEINRRLPYFKYVLPTGEAYLIPYETGQSSTVEEALISMRTSSNDIVEALIPEGVDYDIGVVDGVATVTFKEQLDLTLLDPVEAIMMIEGFMLTAQNYQTAVKIENTVQQQFGTYELTDVLPEPIGVNPIYLP